MKYFRNIPIKRKVILVILLANVVTLLLALLAVLTFQWFHTGRTISRDLLSQGEIIAANSTAALTFRDADTAAETLAPLKSKPHILGAALYVPDGACLASFGDAPANAQSKAPGILEGFHREGAHLVLVQKVLLKNKDTGTLFLRFDFRAMQAEVARTYVVTLGLILPLSLLLALFLSSSLQKVISLPIEELAEIARRVSEQQDYALRGQLRGNDEVGALTTAFNQMLARIQDQDQALRHSEARYRLLFESNPIAMYVCDENSLRFLAANDATVARYGYSRDELLQMTIKEIRPPKEIERLVQDAANKKVLNHAGEWRHRTKDGRLLDVDITTHAFQLDGSPARLILAVDITERKKVEAAWHHRLNMEKLVSEISAHFINLPVAQIDDGIRWALGKLGPCKRADLSWVCLSSSDGKAGTCIHQWSKGGAEEGGAWPERFDCESLRWWSESIKQLRTVGIASVLDMPAEAGAEAAFLSALNIRAVAAVPMVFGKTAIGFLGLACRQESRNWVEENFTALELLAQIIVSALDRKRAGEELETMHTQLVTASRQAGMAEVATGVLHNVGNVLNSVNVSTTLIQDNLRRSEVATLVKVAEVLKQHAADLPAYLAKDPRGKIVPDVIIQLAEQLEREQVQLQAEHASVARNIEHIKEIVAMQQSYAKASGFLEEVSLPALLDDALSINRAGLMRHGVGVLREYEPTPAVFADKHKVLQILINLVNNAKYALDGAPRPDKQITLGICPVNGSRVKITVRDNGVGIPRENLIRIFSHGFTTRSNGHGFGLHSGANAAKEMGGSLSAWSDGPGTGATFTLELPIKDRKKLP